MVSKKEFESEVIQIIEKNDLFCLSFLNGQLKEICDHWKKEHKNKEFPKFQFYETAAIDAMPDFRDDRQIDEPYFRPKVEIVDQESDPPTMRIFPNIYDVLLDQDAISYFESRFGKTRNITLRSRYADLIWEAKKMGESPDYYKYGLITVNEYFELVPYLLKHEYFIHLIKLFKRIAEISILINSLENKNRLINEILNSMSIFREVKRCRYFIELIKILLFLDSKSSVPIDDKNWEAVKFTSIDIYEELKKKKPINTLLVIPILEIIISSAEMLLENETAWKYRLVIANIYKQESENREEGKFSSKSSLVALSYLEDAYHYYQNIFQYAPNDDERDKITKEMGNINPNLRRLIKLTEDEMVSLKIPFEMSKERLDSLINPIIESNPNEILNILSMHPQFIPNVEEIGNQARNTSKIAPLFSLLGKTHFRDGRKVDESPPFTNNDSFDLQMSVWFHVQSIALNYLFSKLKELGLLTKEIFISHFKKWDLFDSLDLPFLEKGIDHYLSGDYMSALHVFIPRIEHMIKSAFEKVGLPLVAIPNTRQIRERTLGNFLTRKEIRSILGEGIWSYLNYVLIDEKGLNLRNDLAHGWIKAEGCDDIATQSCIFSMLLISRLRYHKAVP